jgi:hypothetical protein
MLLHVGFSEFSVHLTNIIEFKEFAASALLYKTI